MAEKNPNVSGSTTPGAAPIGSCGTAQRVDTGTAKGGSAKSGASYSDYATSSEKTSHGTGLPESMEQTREKATMKTGQVMGDAKHRARSLLDNQKGRAAERLEGVAHTIRELSNQMRERHQDSVAQYAERAADQTEYLSIYIRDTDIDEFVDDAQDMARRQPGVFLGGAFALGFLMARFLKSSGQRGGVRMRRSYGYEGGHRYGIPARDTTGDESMVGEVPTYGRERKIPVREER